MNRLSLTSIHRALKWYSRQSKSTTSLRCYKRFGCGRLPEADIMVAKPKIKMPET